MSYNMKLDPITHDIVINRGVERIGGSAYVIQLIKTVLQTHLGEWDLDEKLGIDWFNVMGRNYDLNIVQGLVRGQVQNIKGVERITSVGASIDKATRTATIKVVGVIDGSPFTVEATA